MSVLLALLPVLCLFGGALLYLLPLPLISRYRNGIPLLALGLSAVALTFLARASTAPIDLFESSAMLPELTLTLQWNGAALPFGLCLLAMMAARVLMAHAQDTRAFLIGLLTVSGGALLFLAADNFTSVAAAWLIVEFGLLIAPDPDADSRARVTTAFAWNLAAIALWLSAGMILANRNISLRLTEMELQGAAALLVLLSLWIRSGLYPAHAAAPSDVSGASVRIGIPLLLGGYLMTRLLVAMQASMAFANEFMILAALAIGASALVTAGQWHGGNAFIWMLRAFGAGLLFAPFISGTPELVSASVWLTLAAFMLAVWTSIAWLWRGELARLRLTMLVWLVPLFVAAALPLSPAFLGRVVLLNGAHTMGVAWWLLLVVCAALYLIPIWREILASRDIAPKPPTRFEYAALGMALLPALLILVAPNFFMAPFGAAAQTGASVPVNLLLKPVGVTGLAFIVAGLIVPLLTWFELARQRALRAAILPQALTEFLDLSVVGKGLVRIYHFLRALVLSSLALLEQPPIAWLFFLAIWAAVWIGGLAR